MNKHTPGPWAVDMDGSFYSVVADVGKKWNNPTVCALHYDATPVDSVTIGAWLRHYDNADANARLIAAAPDLLAALEDLLLVANVRIDDPRCPVFDHARAVIARARGE